MARAGLGLDGGARQGGPAAPRPLTGRSPALFDPAGLGCLTSLRAPPAPGPRGPLHLDLSSTYPPKPQGHLWHRTPTGPPPPAPTDLGPQVGPLFFPSLYLSTRAPPPPSSSRAPAWNPRVAQHGGDPALAPGSQPPCAQGPGRGGGGTFRKNSGPAPLVRTSAQTALPAGLLPWPGRGLVPAGPGHRQHTLPPTLGA